MVEMSDAACEISGLRIATLTSSPSRNVATPPATCSCRISVPSATAATAARSDRGMPSRRAFSPSARYMAPVSM